VNISAPRFLRRYALAVACLVGPPILVYGCAEIAVRYLVPEQVADIPLEYRLREMNPGPASQSIVAEPTKSEKKNEPDPGMELYARHLAGRYNFAVANGFVYPLSALTLAFGAAIIYRRTRLPGLVVTTILACVFAFVMAYEVLHHKHARYLVIDRILSKADEHEQLKDLAIKNLPTAEIVNWIMGSSTFLALFAVWFIVGAMFLVSIRDEKVDITLDDLKGRLRVIRLAIILVSMILVLYVIVGKLLLQWPLSLLVEPQQLALQRLIDAVISYWGAIATIALLTIFTPAIIAWWLDVEAYRGGLKDQTKELGDDTATDELEFAPRWMITTLIPVVTPLLASPVLDGLKSVLGALPVR
jgi:hypothetical protein